ncbi:GNAT family N-acetyltransferase [Biostraticola tofi]|uniref:Acetyltransferase (GNAT) family protein n=1 Tax=Biostraticola tofi TaxID=466109 RepID=A0A4R3YMK3_9GAMM|nr:GNAT family N-acetyltransferase [Biostraticola tofi]TCV93540.1 acetyltransferase (GNAT) family protein [Biostraticola tofi]
MHRIAIERLDTLNDGKVLSELADVLLDCVEGGASVSFMASLTPDRAAQYWQSRNKQIEAGEIALLVARDATTRIVGTVQLMLAQPENQPHRADVAKLLVHRQARQQGIGAALMTKAESWARREGKMLLVLDTATGSSAESLYPRLGWQQSGIIPDYALMPDGTLTATTVFFKYL